MHSISSRPARRQLLVAVMAVLMLVGAVLLGAVSVDATEVSAQAARPAPTCPGFGRVPASAVWTDFHSERTSSLVVNLDRMVCSAADGATIDLKSWGIKFDDGYLAGFLARLRLMHFAHHVTVNVLVGHNATSVDWPLFRRQLRFAHVAWCRAACKTAARDGVSHSKWITVSRLRNHLPAVLSTSANLTHQQLALQTQSGVFISGNFALYRDFLARWAIYQHCARLACDRTVRATDWKVAGHLAVYFAPAANDVLAEELSHVTCAAGGGSIDIASLFFNRRPAVLEQLTRLQDEGCTLRVLLERPFSSFVARKLHPRHIIEHDKYILVHTRRLNEVIAGSEDLASHELYSDDNQMLRVRLPSVVHSYTRIFNYQWARSVAVAPAAHITRADVRETS